LDQKAEEEALVPWADFANHSSACSSHLTWDHQEECVVLIADRNYAAGQQVYTSYGERSSAQLLFSYGFVPEAGTNPHDSVLLSLQVRSASVDVLGTMHQTAQ
jgi:SET domain